MQGFQVLVDCDSGFGGLCVDFLQDFVREECRTAPTLVFGLMDSLTVNPIDGCADGLYRSNSSGDSTLNSQRIASRSINQSLALHTLGDIASVFVPVHAHSLHTAADATLFRSDAFSDRDMRPLHAHHAASLLASAVDTIVLPFRLRRGSLDGTYHGQTGGASGRHPR